MKKILLTLALAAFAFTANAQIIVGGNISFNHDGYSTDDNCTGANTEISLMPKIGYQLNETMQIGAQLGCTYDYTRTYTTSNDYYNSRTQLTWKFAPYLRYNLTTWKNFTVFAEAQLGLGITPKSSWKSVTAAGTTTGDGATNAFDLTLDVVPGLNYSLTDKISLDLYIDLLGLYYRYNATTTDLGTTETTDYTHSYGFKANMDPQPFLGFGAGTLTGHLTLFRLGFNYAL